VFGKTSRQSKNERDNGRPDAGGEVSVISKDLRVMGDLSSRGRLRIHGKVSGDVTARGVELTSTGSVEGDVIAAGGSDGDQLFVIDGSVDGRVCAAHVEVGPNGSVTGGVVADTAVIHGRVQRSIVVRDRLALGETAVVVGDVSTRRLSVMEGGGVNGTIRMGEPVATEAPREMLSRGAAAIKQKREAASAAWSEVERDTLDRESRKPVLALSKEPAAQMSVAVPRAGGTWHR